MTNEPLSENDPRLPSVRVRLVTLIRSLYRHGVISLPLALAPGGAPSLRYLHTLVHALRVEILAESLLNSIVPAIEQKMSGTGNVEWRSSPLPPTASVDWARTARKSLSGTGDPSVVVRRWRRSLDLPENRLVVLCLHEVMTPFPVNSLLVDDPEGARRSIRRRARLIRHARPWNEIPLDDSEPHLDQIRARIDASSPYGPLLDWWSLWRASLASVDGKMSLPDPAIEPDWLFELLVLFELVSELARALTVRQVRPLGLGGRGPAFVARTPAGALDVYYRSGAPLNPHRALDGLVAVPDVVIRLPGTPPRFVILDAKNYGPRAHAQAIYKMLGYLYQFGYAPDGEHNFANVLAGTLVFPTEEREGSALKDWQRETAGAQRVLTFVLPPESDPEYSGMADFVTWLRRQILDS